MTEKIGKRPYCGSDCVDVKFFFDVWCGKCINCSAAGPEARDKSDAILLWNAAANQLAAKDAEIARLTAALADTEEQRHEAVSKLSLALIREVAGNKRQAELEAEIEKLRKEHQDYINDVVNTNTNEWKKFTNNLKNERDKAIAEIEKLRKPLKDCQDMSQLNLECHYDTKERLKAERDEARRVARVWKVKHDEYKLAYQTLYAMVIIDARRTLPPTSRVDATDKETP